MLVTLSDAIHRVHVHSPLMSKCTHSHKRLTRTEIHVGDFVDVPRQLGQMRDAAGNECLPALFERQIGDHADQIDVAAPLADAVDRPLHLHGAMPDGHQGICRRHIAIVVTVNSDRDFERTPRGIDPGGDPFGKAAAVRIAQHDDFCSTLLSGLNRFQREVRIPGEPVEKMFGIVDHAASLGPQEGNRIADHRQVFLLADIQDVLDVQIPTLTHERDDFRLGVDEGLHSDIFFRGHALSSRHAEGGHFGMLERHVGHAAEIIRILRIGEWIPAFDEVKSKLIQFGGDCQLVFEGEIDPLALATVAKRCVVNLDASHLFSSGNAKTPRRAA